MGNFFMGWGKICMSSGNIFIETGKIIMGWGKILIKGTYFGTSFSGLILGLLRKWKLLSWSEKFAAYFESIQNCWFLDWTAPLNDIDHVLKLQSSRKPESYAMPDIGLTWSKNGPGIFPKQWYSMEMSLKWNWYSL